MASGTNSVPSKLPSQEGTIRPYVGAPARPIHHRLKEEKRGE